ncbi:MAG TPA: Gfo/Idh/MocA family oxidoreductase [Blastocatellia bacterium]|nr:Gfo/Idh/MocA family oxidoreductase [Blastocatellia bacterium]
MRRVRVGLIGAGFVGPLHVEAIRRLGYVDVTGVAASSIESARRRAERLGVERAYSSYEELLSDRDIEAVHICAPNYLHYQIAMSALAHGKHVICDKPLGLTSVEAREMMDRAKKCKLVNAVTFNYRFNPLVQQARSAVAHNELGQIRFVHGYYLQDWLIHDTDFSWRLEPEKGGASAAIGDIGSHWLDTAQFITGRQVTRVLASLQTTIPVRKKPAGSREAFAAAAGEHTENYLVTSDDLGSVMLEFDNGAKGLFCAGQVCAGHKNDLRIEVNGAKGSIEWKQERPNEMWMGYRDRPNGQLLRDAALLDESVRHYTNLPGGHNEGWADAFKHLMAAIYSFIAEGRDPIADSKHIDFPTFEDGYRANCAVDAIVRSNQDRSIWTEVEY